MRITLQRVTSTAKCTQGVLTVAENTFQTLERAWVPVGDSKSGAPGVSCIAPGVYQLVKHSSELHPRTWALVNAGLDLLHFPDPLRAHMRAAVLIHVGNYPHDSNGCILVGVTKSNCTVWSSGVAFRSLQNLLPWDDSNEIEILGVPS